MKPVRGTIILVLFLSILAGCSKKSTENQSASSKTTAETNPAETNPKETVPSKVPSKETKLAESLKASGAKLKNDKDGFVIEVDFRGTRIDDGTQRDCRTVSFTISTLK